MKLVEGRYNQLNIIVQEQQKKVHKNQKERKYLRKDTDYEEVKIQLEINSLKL